MRLVSEDKPREKDTWEHLYKMVDAFYACDDDMLLYHTRQWLFCLGLQDCILNTVEGHEDIFDGVSKVIEFN